MANNTYNWGWNASAPTASSFAGSQTIALPASVSWSSYAILGLVGYATLCSALRFRRINSLKSQLRFTDRASLSRMTIDEARIITKHATYYEFPTFYDLSLRLALLRTYSVKNVAKTLVGVSDLAKEEHAPKRYEDTAILYSCFLQFKPHDEAFLKAVARMNYLHAPYIKAGKILNEDLIYVLWASMADPVRFIGLYEWRPCTEMEQAAFGAQWKHIGDLMGIDYKAELGHDSWKDGIEFIDELTVWAGKYEDKYMHPYPEVRKLGQVLMDLLLTSHPKFARPIAYQISLVVMGDRMRHAFGYPEPGLVVTQIAYSLLLVRMLAVRFLALPRLWPFKNLSEPHPKTRRMHHYRYMKEPWYNPPTFTARWGLQAWFTWAFGGMLPGDGGSELKPEGFLFEDIGPKVRVGKGLDEIGRAGHLASIRPANASPFTAIGSA